MAQVRNKPNTAPEASFFNFACDRSADLIWIKERPTLSWAWRLQDALLFSDGFGRVARNMRVLGFGEQQLEEVIATCQTKSKT